jgi:hypothetical protein
LGASKRKSIVGNGKENMSNNSVVGQTGKLEGAQEKSSRKWNHSIGIGIVGCLWLSGAIGSLQHMTEVFANDVDKVVFIANWIPWLAILCFALGWFTTHWIEIALSNNQIVVAKLLSIAVLIEVFSISAYFHFFSNNSVLYRFDSAVLPLIFSGCFLRYSVFRQESLLQIPKTIFGRQAG